MRKIFSIAAALFISVTAFAQEDQVEEAQDAFKDGNLEQAKALVDKININDDNYFTIEPEIVSDFLFVKGNIYLALGEKNDNSDELIAAAVAYADLAGVEKGKQYYAKNKETGDYTYFRFQEDLDKAMASGEYKKPKVKDRKKYHSEEATPLVSNLAIKFHQGAIDAYNAKDFKKSRMNFVSAFQVYNNPLLGKSDTTLLFNAAAVGISENNYPASLTIYEQLLDINYTGITSVYEAKNKETGETNTFTSKKDMDMQIKFGVVENDTTYVTENKQPSIYKSIGSIYLSLGDDLAPEDSLQRKEYYQKAIVALKDGKNKFPTDEDLLLALGNAYLKAGNQQGFIDAMQEAIEKDPTNEVLFYNIGVVSNNLGMKEESKKAYEKAIELKPDYTDAYINISALILSREGEINEEISALPIKLNKKNRDKLKALNTEKQTIYKDAIVYLEGAYEYDKTNISLLQTMKNIYYALDRNDDFMRVKKEVDALNK